MPAAVLLVTVAQAGLEATPGTGVAATHVVDHDPGSFNLKRDIKKIRIRNAGSLATGHRSYPGQEMVAVDYSFPVTYDRLIVYLNQFLGPLTAGAGAGADKTWTWDGTKISDLLDQQKRTTFEVGGTNWPSDLKVVGCAGDKLTLSIKQNDNWQGKVAYIGMVTTEAARTGALTLPATLVDVLGTTTKVYIDSSTIGTTQVVGSIVTAEIEIDLGTAARFTLDSTGTPYRIAQPNPRVIGCKMVAEFGALTEYDAWVADTARKVRIVSTGPVLGGSFYKAQFDLYGTWEAAPLGWDNGVGTLALELKGRYDATAAAEIGAVVICSLVALP